MCTKKSSPALQELWGVRRWFLPGCTPRSLCWITSKRWIYSVSDCSGSWGGTRDLSGAELGDWCNLKKKTNDFLLLMLYSQVYPDVTFIQSGILGKENWNHHSPFHLYSCSWKQEQQEASFSLAWIYIRPEPPLIQSHWAPARAAAMNILFHIIQVTSLSRAVRNRHMPQQCRVEFSLLVLAGLKLPKNILLNCMQTKRLPGCLWQPTQQSDKPPPIPWSISHPCRLTCCVSGRRTAGRGSWILQHSWVCGTALAPCPG